MSCASGMPVACPRSTCPCPPKGHHDGISERREHSRATLALCRGQSLRLLDISDVREPANGIPPTNLMRSQTAWYKDSRVSLCLGTETSSGCPYSTAPVEVLDGLDFLSLKYTGNVTHSEPSGEVLQTSYLCQSHERALLMAGSDERWRSALQLHGGQD